MNFIELTYYDGSKVYVFPDKILYFMNGNGDDKERTFIEFDNEVRLWVNETPEQVLQKIKECKK